MRKLEKILGYTKINTNIGYNYRDIQSIEIDFEKDDETLAYINGDYIEAVSKEEFYTLADSVSADDEELAAGAVNSIINDKVFYHVYICNDLNAKIKPETEAAIYCELSEILKEKWMTVNCILGYVNKETWNKYIGLLTDAGYIRIPLRSSNEYVGVMKIDGDLK